MHAATDRSVLNFWGYIMENFEIYVTESHIENGERWDCQACPISLALSEVLGNVKVYTSGSSITFTDPGYEIRQFYPSNDVRKWIAAFDYNDPVKPITLKFDVENMVVLSY